MKTLTALNLIVMFATFAVILLHLPVYVERVLIVVYAAVVILNLLLVIWIFLRKDW